MTELDKQRIAELELELKSLKKKANLSSKKESSFTEEELFKLRKHAQIRLLNQLGAEEIPRYEKDRVKLILELSE